MKILLRDRIGKTMEGSSIAKRMEEIGLLDVTSDYGSLPVCWGGYVGKLVYEVCFYLIIIFITDT